MSELKNKIVDVYVESCCGTWCVYVKDFSGDTMRIANITMNYDDGGKNESKALAYAKLIKKILV